jgi:glycosyltransferase involved in cell wall biosynthesis
VTIIPLASGDIQRRSATRTSNRQMNVAVASTLGPGGMGGIDRLMDSVNEGLSRRPELGICLRRLTTRGKGSILRSPLYLARAIHELRSAAKRRDVDVVHLNLSQRGSTYRKLIVAAAAERLQIPYVVHLHGSGFTEFWDSAGTPVKRGIAHLFMKSAEVIVLGNFWRSIIEERLPEVRGKISVLPNATESHSGVRVPPFDGRVRISFLGEVGERKGTPELLRALGHLKRRSDWVATIAGNGAVAEAQALATELEIQHRVSFPGWLNAIEARHLLERTDVFVLPSHAENLPMAILEAFAHGIACISTPVGAIPEVIQHGRSGLLSPVGDVPALAAAINGLIEGDEIRNELGAVARRHHAEFYERNRYLDRLAAIWRRVGSPMQESL